VIADGDPHPTVSQGAILWLDKLTTDPFRDPADSCEHSDMETAGPASGPLSDVFAEACREKSSILPTDNFLFDAQRDPSPSMESSTLSTGIRASTSQPVGSCVGAAARLVTACPREVR
jgi:hypothetical protein